MTGRALDSRAQSIQRGTPLDQPLVRAASKMAGVTAGKTATPFRPRQANPSRPMRAGPSVELRTLFPMGRTPSPRLLNTLPHTEQKRRGRNPFIAAPSFRCGGHRTRQHKPTRLCESDLRRGHLSGCFEAGKGVRPATNVRQP